MHLIASARIHPFFRRSIPLTPKSWFVNIIVNLFAKKLIGNH